MRRVWPLVLLGVPALGSACQGAGGEPPAPAPSASAPPVDRLARGELAPGTESIWGLVLPRGMRVTARFPGTVHAAGRIPPEEVANYVRERVVVARVELGAARTIFPATRIKGGDQGRLYQVEVVAARNGGTHLEVRDVTPAPPTPEPPGMTDEKRLERVGLKPNGELIDRSKLE